MRPTRLIVKRIDWLMGECFLNLNLATTSPVATSGDWREFNTVGYARAAWRVALRLSAAQRNEALRLREVVQ